MRGEIRAGGRNCRRGCFSGQPMNTFAFIGENGTALVAGHAMHRKTTFAPTPTADLPHQMQPLLERHETRIGANLVEERIDPEVKHLGLANVRGFFEI